jgi:hypothetical protein
MKIKGRDFILTPRRADRVLDLAAAVDIYKEADNNTNDTLFAAQVVADSLRATQQKLGRIRGLRYWLFLTRRDNMVGFLIRELSLAELMSAYITVLELEGAEKKSLIPIPGNLSEEK